MIFDGTFHWTNDANAAPPAPTGYTLLHARYIIGRRSATRLGRAMVLRLVTLFARPARRSRYAT